MLSNVAVFLTLEMLIFLLKEIFSDYIANGSSMYVTMLNASKAFDSES